MASPYTSAIVAILRASEMPPTQPTSSMTIDTARFSRASRKAQQVDALAVGRRTELVEGPDLHRRVRLSQQVLRELVGPPIKRYSGSPAAWAVMSHTAVSIADSPRISVLRI
jgi:hypothetical protein